MGNKTNILGGAVILIILGLIAFLIISRGSSNQQEDIRDTGQAQLQLGKDILKPDLAGQLTVKPQGVMQIVSGDGQLANQMPWRYLQEIPAQEVRVSDVDGISTTLKSSGGPGPGGELTLKKVGKLKTEDIQALMRATLNDPNLQVVGQSPTWGLSSRYIVADSIVWSRKKEQLKVKSLYLASQCPKRRKPSDNPGLDRSCWLTANGQPPTAKQPKKNQKKPNYFFK